MRNVADDFGQQRAERPRRGRLMKCGVAHSRADQQLAVIRFDAIEPGHLVDVDKMCRLRQPERHDRHEALPAGKHAAVLRRDLGKNFQRLVERPRHMADERRRLHVTTRGDCLYANDKPQAAIVKPL